MEEAETEIRRTVKDEYFKKTPKAALDAKINNIIKGALKKITIPDLALAAKRSLINFYIRQYNEIIKLNGQKFLILLAILELLKDKPLNYKKIEAEKLLTNIGISKSNLSGVPLQKFSENYIKENVKPVLDKLSKQFTLDPDDVTGRNSLRNRAEMEVRYHGHLEQIQELKSNGNKLVIASTHADCSDRCRPFQGKVYSLDGTSGTTDDGRKFVPLEEATNVPYTTKAGKTYMNGLLGFNCRHYLVPYKSGFHFPKPDAKEERRQYNITVKQRQLERNVIKWKTIAVENKDVNKKEYLYARKKAIEWNKVYINFSEKNNRAYYPSRTKIL